MLSTGQLAATGISRATARHAVRTGRWYAPMRGFVGVVDVRDDASSAHVVERRRHALTATAACLARPGHAVTGRSAAILHGLPTLAVPDRPELTETQALTRGRRGSAHIFVAELPPGAVTERYGIGVASVARTVVDVARHDRADELARALDTAIRWPGVVQAREVVALASGLAESPIESLLRLALHDDGFPTPVPQFPVHGYYADLALPEYGLLLEADGREKYTGDELWREKRREQAMRRDGWWCERVFMSDVLEGWPLTRRRIRRAMRPGWRPSY